MSSCQDSWDTEDSIPQPEYEQIVPNENDDEDCDEEFWDESRKRANLTLTNGVQLYCGVSNVNNSQTQSSDNQTSLNHTKTYPSKDVVDEMEESCDEEDTSYDEADETFEEKDVNVSKNYTEEVNNRKPIEPPLPSRDPLNLAEESGVTESDVSNRLSPITALNQNLIIDTQMKENVKQIVPQSPVENQNQTMDVSEELKNCQADEEKLSVPKEEQTSRSNTPSNRGTREFIALQRAFINSKVLSEFVSEKDRSRKTRKVPLKSNDSIESEEKEKFRICRARSKSCTRTALMRPVPAVLNNSAPQKWPSDEKLNSKRENMRSQNTDFVQKQMKFLNRVNQEHTADDQLTDASDGEQSLNESQKVVVVPETKDDWQPPPKKGSDSFCWKCKKCMDLIACSKCPRSYHSKCVKMCASMRLDKMWTCPECITLESCINGSKKAKKEALSVDTLNQLLLFALKRMKQVKGHEQLLDVPDEAEYPLYSKYVVNPVTLNSIQDKIEKKAFRCTEEFVLETKWIQHNVSIAYAAYNNKITAIAKIILKVCRQEAAEIETCSECYLNANTRKDWFVDVCLKPHILLWAKLKGFPYWPAKGMGLGPNSLVNVRFFGDHDRAFVPVKDCFLYSETDPNPYSGKRSFRPGIADCIKEVDVHIENIKAKIGAFNFAPGRTPYDSSNEMTQLEEMMPGVTEYIKRQQTLQKPPLTYKIVKTAGNNLSMIKKPDSGTDSDHSSLGAERNRRKSRSSAELSKSSPHSDAKRSKDLPNTSQNTTPKASLPNKSTPNKTMSSNYEVVAKPMNKDETNSSKINSVILKRKSDIVLMSSNLKKSKSDEDVQANESNCSALSEITKNEPLTVELPAKRARISRSGEKTPVAVQIPTAIVPAYHVASNETPKSSHSHQEQTTPTPPKTTYKQPQTPDVGANPFSNDSFVNDTPSAMAKLVQNRQGVTIRKIYTKPSGVNSYTPLDETNLTPKSAAEERITSKAPHAQSKPTSLSEPSSTPSTPASKHASLPSKPMSSNTSARVQTSPKPTSTVSEKSPTPTGLIPFEDIKVERAEDEQAISTPLSSSSSRLIDPLASSSNTSTPTLMFSATTPSANCKSNNPIPSTSPLPIDPDLVKRETVSDDETSSSSTLSRENTSPTISIAAQQSTAKPQPAEGPRIVGETMIQRIVVRSLESLTMQPPAALKNTTPNTATSVVSSIQSPTTSSVASAQPKKAHARARKSFPNKANMSPRSLTKNSMVYIPVDSQNNSVPIQPLTAVSKPTNQVQSAPKPASITTIPVSTPISQSLTSGSPSTNCIPVTSPMPVLQVTAHVTASTTAVVSAMNSVSSSTAMVVSSSVTTRPSYISTLKTLSPLQLATSTSNANETETASETGREVAGHILSGVVTPSLAAAITDTIVRGPPRLAPRPNGALRSDGNYGFNSDAGPVCRALVEGAHKMTDFFISVMKDTIHDMASVDIMQAKIVELQMELETKVASYEKRLFELKQNTDTMLCEMKKSMENERLRIIAETRKQCEIERIHAVEQTKKRQWCVNCGREANSYCCWNTAYCDTNCQSMDWLRHKPHCCQVNPHLNSEVQGPGRLYSAPTTVTACTTITTPSSQTISGAAQPNFLPLQPVSVYRPSIHSASTPPSATSALLPTSVSMLSTTGAAQKKGNSPPDACSLPISATTTEIPFKNKEILKLPPRTYLRPVSATVQRFKLPQLPIGATSAPRGPPFTLVHREGGNWELMGTGHPPTAAAATFQQQTPRMVTTVTTNLPPDGRVLGQVIVRPSQM